MRIIFIIILSVLISSCLRTGKKTEYIRGLQGQSINTAVQALGYPDTERDFNGTKIYNWNNTETVDEYEIGSARTSTKEVCTDKDIDFETKTVCEQVTVEVAPQKFGGGTYTCNIVMGVQGDTITSVDLQYNINSVQCERRLRIQVE